MILRRHAENTFLQNLQQFNLHCSGNCIYFIQENSPFLGTVKTSQFTLCCTRKGTFFIAEQLTFNQRVRQCPTMYMDKCFIFATAVLVNQFCHHAFADTGIPQQQNCSFCWCHRFDFFKGLKHPRASGMNFFQYIPIPKIILYRIYFCQWPSTLNRHKLTRLYLFVFPAIFYSGYNL